MSLPGLGTTGKLFKFISKVEIWKFILDRFGEERGGYREPLERSVHCTVYSGLCTGRWSGYSVQVGGVGACSVQVGGVGTVYR